MFLILPLSGSLCCLIIKTSFLFRPPKKNKPSVSSGAAEVVVMLYDTSPLMQCQAKKYSGLNFARKIRYVAPDVSSKIWYCGTSIGLTYDGLIASANFCRNRFCPTCQWRRSVKLFRQNYDCFEWIKAKYPGCRFVFLTLTVRNVLIDSLVSRLADMSAAWNRFTQRRDFKSLGLLGWLRVLEVTRNAYTGTYHPHFHVVLVVPFGCWLPGHSWWLRCWQLAARDASIMFVNLRVVDGSKSSIKEVSKYVVKDSDFAGSAWVSDFPKLYKALAHVRCFCPAGCWRDARRALGFVDPDKDSLTDDVSTGGIIKDFVYLYNFKMFACIGFH